MITGRLSIFLSPMVSILAAFLVGAVLMLLFDKNPLVAYSALFRGAFGSPFAVSNTVSNSVPLIFTGLTVALGFRAGLFNIGAEGQVLLGALVAAWLGPMVGLPGWPHVALIIAASGLAGALWAGPPAIFKVKTGAHEVITTLMMSFIAIQLVGLILRVFLRDPFSSSGASKDIAASAEIASLGELFSFLPAIIGSSHAGILLALIAALLIWLLLEKTSWGFDIRSFGANPVAAVTHGIREGRTIAMALLVGGALAGIAGAIQIMAVQHKLYARSAVGLGFAGIAVALLANNHPMWVIPSAILFGALQSGATQMQLAADVPIELAEAMQGTIVFVVATQGVVRLAGRGFWARAA